MSIMDGIEQTTVVDNRLMVNSDLEAFTRNMALINEVGMAMKEIPILPSEQPPKDDIHPLEKVEFPEGGGIYTYMVGNEYPYKGFPLAEIVEKVDLLKKIVRNTLSGSYHEVKNKPKILFITLLPSLWLAKKSIRVFVYVFYRIFERFRLKRERYCESMRELYRAFGEGELQIQLRDILCMFMEFDNAYRYRFQDLVVEIDQQRVKTNTIKELKRIFDIAIEREKTQEIRDTWKLCKYFLIWYLRFDRELKHIFADTFSRIDKERVKLDEADRAYCIKRKDYTFGFTLDNDKLLRTQLFSSVPIPSV